MRHIYELTAPFEADDLDVTHIRFPNTAGKPLAGCEAGTIIYVFTPGEVTVCPYLVFAARTPGSQHDPSEFIVGNIFTDPDIAARLDGYRFHDRYQVGTNPTCGACAMSGSCGKGLPGRRDLSGWPDRGPRCRAVPRHHRWAAAAAAGSGMTPPPQQHAQWPGLFVSFDGPGGVGKSTVLSLLANTLQSNKLAVHATTQPSRTRGPG